MLCKKRPFVASEGRAQLHRLFNTGVGTGAIKRPCQLRLNSGLGDFARVTRSMECGANRYSR